MHNHLKTIEVGSFDGLVSLRELYIHDNKIIQLDSSVFRGLKHVGPQLNLMNNNLQVCAIFIVFYDSYKPMKTVNFYIKIPLLQK